MARLGLLLVACAGLAFTGLGQGTDGIRNLHERLASCAGEDCRQISDALADALSEFLSQEADWSAEGGIADFMATVQSTDERLRVMTWNWPHEDRTSSYGGLVAFRDEPGAPVEFTLLHDPSSADRPDANRILKPDEWTGALYYAMVPDAIDDDVWLLLGWDDADAHVTRKIIEPLQIRPKGPRFGAGVLQTPMGLQRRYILEYADAVQASLRYQPASRGKEGHPQRVLFDHLAPREPHLTGISAYYGPDMTFDAFVPGKKDGSPWMLQEQTDAIQPLQEDRPFNDPRPRNGRRNRR